MTDEYSDTQDTPRKDPNDDHSAAGGQATHTGTIGDHPAVTAIAGSPPWFPCQRCGASRTTHDGLRDLPCEPDRYTDVDPTTRVQAGAVVRARVDQTRAEPTGTRTVLVHTHETGVRVILESVTEDVVRGDVLMIRIDSIDPRVDGTLDKVVSTDQRVRSPTLTYVGTDADE